MGEGAEAAGEELIGGRLHRLTVRALGPRAETRRLARWPALAAAVIAWAGAVGEASAAGPRVSLRWSAPEGCPAGARVVAEVERLLGEAGARPPAPLEASASVSADPEGPLRVHLEVGGTDGPRVRELTAASCDALADATALIIAMMIDPAAVAAAPPPPAAPPAPVAPPVDRPTPTPTAPPPEPAREPRPRPRFHLLAWALADAGSLPGVSFAAGGTAAVSVGALRIELSAGAHPARAALTQANKSAGGDVSLVTGSAGACYGVLPAGKIELAPCAAFEVGRLHATGFGVSSPNEGSALWTAARPGVRFAWWPLSRMALVLRAEAAIPFARPTFVLENVGTVHRPGPVAGRLGGGLEAAF